jgi:hypothetical protein
VCVGAAVLLLFLCRGVRAEDRRCDGPTECCPRELVEHLDKSTSVQVGVVVMGITNINERSGTWDADFYLYERWRPAAGFTPQTEVVNESERHATQFDTTESHDGFCQRSRRVRSTLRSSYNLRRFPFDQQRLLLEISDDQFTTSDVVYSDVPQPLGFDDDVRDSVSGWKVEDDLAFSHRARTFAWERGAPAYDYATVTVPVKRIPSATHVRKPVDGSASEASGPACCGILASDAASLVLLAGATGARAISCRRDGRAGGGDSRAIRVGADCAMHLVVAASELGSVLGPEEREEGGDLGRRRGAELRRAHVDGERAEARRARRADVVHLNDEVGARARGVGTMLIDGPIRGSSVLEEQIPIRGEQAVVREHCAGLRALECSERGAPISLSRGTLDP